jgi:excinuclease ABC subunit A
VEFPLGRLVVITGVSGSGKSTLMRDLLWPALQARLDKRVSRNSPETGATSSELPGATLPDVEENDALASEAASSDRGPGLDGVEQLSRALLVDQSPLGRTPRSNPAVYVGAFDAIRDVFAATEMARQRGLSAGAFSFNASQGQCETCRGAGFEKIEMQFLSDVYIRCPACAGRRYRPHILEVTIEGTSRNDAAVKRGKKRKPARTAWNIADLLDATIEQAIQFLSALENSRAAGSAVRSLNVLREVGLGYLRLGQPINTLSGGEAQRLKLAAHLAEFHRASSHQGRPSLFLFDEPTTGLHFDDVRVLLQVFQKLVGLGHSVFVIEHNLDVMKAADWIIDLGPEAGEGGGKVVAAGTPEQIMECAESRTGHALVKPQPSPVPHRPRA